MPASLKSPGFCHVGGIHGFSGLFPSAEASRSKKQQITFGSTMLISGPPGAGKTTFSLALVRAMMATANALHPNEKTIAYFVSSEVHEKKLSSNFSDFGWFSLRPNKRCDEFKFRIDSQAPDDTNFYAITPMPEIDRPVPSPEELVNGVFNRIAHTLLPSEAPTERAKIYVIIDSITALLKGCATAGEERRQTHEIVRRLRDRFGAEHLALTILLAEHDHRSEHSSSRPKVANPSEPSVEDYLADIVFRLYVRSLPLGRRSRVLEVVKSQGVNMMLGEHTWQIVSQDNSEIIRLEGFRAYLKQVCRDPAKAFHGLSGPDNEPATQLFSGDKWGGIIIFPRPQLNPRLQIITGEVEEPVASKFNTGTEGLEVDVSPGKFTLIAGPMGCGKTSLCRQFLMEGADASDGEKRVLISFDVPGPGGAKTGPYTNLHFTQSQFDLNVLVSHILWLLEHGCERIAFDGLSEWITMFDRPEAARVLEALMVTMKKSRPNTPAVFLTYEMPQDDDPMGPAVLGTAADNLIVVRQVPIKDQFRRIIYLIKAEGKSSGSLSTALTHRHPGELKIRGERYYVDLTSLEAYTGLLISQVSPANVLIQLFAENNQERIFNEELVERLRQQYSKRVQLNCTTFSLAEIGTTLETAFGAGNPGEAFNIAIHSVDEWWLKAQKTGEFLSDIQERPSRQGPNFQDFWWFEVDKALGLTTQEKRNRAWYAVPGYIDFGMFCINVDALSPHFAKQIEPKEGEGEKAQAYSKSELNRYRWRRLLHMVPRVWANQIRFKGIPWFNVGSKNKPTVLSFAIEATDQAGRPNDKRKRIFSFDSSTRETSACTFFELAWAFGARESFLSKSARDSDREAARQALLFLGFLVMEGLLPARSSAESRNHGGAPILLSRHWYSSLLHARAVTSNPACSSPNDGESSGNETSERLSGLVVLPFMPLAISDPERAADSLADDIIVRQFYWIKRASTYCRTHAPKNCGRVSVLERACRAGFAEKSWRRKIAAALNIYSKSRRLLLDIARHGDSQSPADAETRNWAPDLDDLIELASWAAFRLRLFFGTKKGGFPAPQSLGSKKPSKDAVSIGIYEMRWVRHCLPNLDRFRALAPRATDVVPTGYVCSGSWMFGVGKDSRSLEIQAQMLNELTSLESAEKRARTGAGMPARKDFFFSHGEKPVPEMSYLNWHEILRYGGSRARLRQRVLIGPEDNEVILKDSAQLFNVVHREILGCLRAADLHRKAYSSGAKYRSVKALSLLADEAINRIYFEAGKITADVAKV